MARIRRRDESPEAKQVRLAERRKWKRATYGEKAAQAWVDRVVELGLGCEVCGNTVEDIGIDHDHACDAGHPIKQGCDKCFRGILCSSCNGALGLVRDDVDRLLALASYLLMRGGGEKADRDSVDRASFVGG
jgi:hypothetical protein